MTSSARPLGPASQSPHVDFICGWFAGCAETCILYPLVKLTFRQQLHGVVLKEAFSQVLKEGVPFLYRGLLPPLIQRTTTRMIMFGMYDTYQRALGCSSTPHNFTACHGLAAFLAGATEGVLCPFERVQVLLQNSAYHSHFRNTSGAFAAGLSLIVLRNGLSNTIFFTLKEPLKHVVLGTMTIMTEKSPPPSRKSVSSEQAQDLMLPLQSNSEQQTVTNHLLSVFCDFVTGALLGATISTLFFPVNVVKHRMQSTIGTPFASPLEVFQTVWVERNRTLKELYRGVHLNYTRSLMTWGITNTVYEFLKRFLSSVD
uniref:Solute carrier family 25 member 51 n=1 Tax=Ditylenchus dipsaci TaxID=166011 RepID=A0A915EAD6_9BILA